jgi:hypothetical protein
MILGARWEGIHQKVDIAGRVEIFAADCHRGRGRDTAGPDFREHSQRRKSVSENPVHPKPIFEKTSSRQLGE